MSLSHISLKLKTFIDDRAFIPRFKFISARLIDVIYPQQAFDTDPDIKNYAAASAPSQAAGLSPDSWNQIRFLSDEGCDMCAAPFLGDVNLGSDVRCAACNTKPFPFSRTRAACLYSEASKGLILAFKHADRLDLRPTLVGWLSRAGSEILEEADVLIPVPLHATRLWERRYNQAAELARPLARQWAKDYLPDALIRIRPTHTQNSQARTHKGRLQDRTDNVKDAFKITDIGQRRVRGRHIILVDDVFTSGATLSECAKVLLTAGARQVDVLVLARASGAAIF
jgi:ComF family protein